MCDCGMCAFGKRHSKLHEASFKACTHQLCLTHIDLGGVSGCMSTLTKQYIVSHMRIGHKT